MEQWTAVSRSFDFGRHLSGETTRGTTLRVCDLRTSDVSWKELVPPVSSNPQTMDEIKTSRKPRQLRLSLIASKSEDANLPDDN